MPMMRRKKIQESMRPFLDRVRRAEERLFAGQFSQEDTSMMQSAGRRFWHFRPSHHVATRLVTEEDLALLSRPGRRLLSVGALPAFLERTLCALGVPSQAIFLADKDAGITACAGPLSSVVFDATGAWPRIGTFDRIIFPESLCIAIGDRIREGGTGEEDATGDHPTDGIETALLTSLLRSALRRLRPGGVIRANGPMSHPKVIRAVIACLRREYPQIVVESRRFFLAVSDDPDALS